MAVKHSKADSRLISSDEEMPSRRQRSLSLATGSDEAPGQTQPSHQIDFDEQVAWLVQQKMEEFGIRKHHDSEEESE